MITHYIITRHTHTKQTDVKRREKNQENQTHTGHKKNAGDGQTESEREERIWGKRRERRK